MRRIRTLLVFVVLLLLASSARADSISFDTGQPTSPAKGKVSATGSVTLDTGHAVTSVTMYVFIPGGPGAAVSCMVDQKNSTWSGTQAGLPTGTYTVVVRAVISGATFDSFTTVKTIAVTGNQ
jgi:hypothetical protein